MQWNMTMREHTFPSPNLTNKEVSIICKYCPQQVQITNITSSIIQLYLCFLLWTIIVTICTYVLRFALMDCAIIMIVVPPFAVHCYLATRLPSCKYAKLTHSLNVAYPAKFASVRRFWWASRWSACTATRRILTTATRDSCRGMFSWGRCRRRGSTALWCPAPCQARRTASATCWLWTIQYPSPSQHPSICPVHTINQSTNQSGIF